MHATDFEFRHRFWVILAIYAAGFWCYVFDHETTAVALAARLAGHPLQFDSAADRHVLQAVFGVAAVLAILAALLRTWGAAYLQSEVVHDPNLRAEALVADGPYRYVRNPLYLGSLLLAVAFGLLASRIGFVVIVVGQTLLYYRLLRREEAALLETQGESYREFLAKVPRLAPSLRPRLPSGGAKARWGQAWLGETFMWLFTVAVAAFAATLNERVFYALIGLALASSLLAQLRRRTSTAATEKRAP